MLFLLFVADDVVQSVQRIAKDFGVRSVFREKQVSFIIESE